MGSNTLVTVPRSAGGVVALAVALALALGVTLGVAVSPLHAQKVLLRVQPHVGDTLHMKMEQHIEMCDDTVNGQTGSSMSAVMRIYTRAIAEHQEATSTAMRSITDSVTITPASAASFPMFAQTKRALEGRTVRLRVERDGGISVEGPGLSQRLPAVLPDKPVERGDVWTRDMSVPVSATHGSTGLVRVTFRLDSLAQDETIAYVSMHGTFSHDHPKATGDETRDETSGTIEGTMQIDRRLEWVTDSRTTITLLSTVRKPPAPPARVHMKITQAMRAMPRR